ncbi:MAG: T9SS type A sorting domain-containing protein, partial [Bacteroidota bacterium]|nr:T9SS type A sorting domain-containing protein [Bacteroidota bacterium]
NINTGDNKITVGESKTDYGTLNYTSGQVIGKYEKWLTSTNHSDVKQFFPVGTDAYCRPAEPTFTIGGDDVGGGTVIAEFVASNPGNDGLPLQDPPQTDPDSVHNTFIEGYWTLTPDNGISITGYDLELTGNGFSSFPIDAETRLLTRASSGSNWTNEGTHVNAVNPTAKRTGLTTFLAHFCFGDDTDCKAPVTSSITGSTSVCTDDTNVVYSVTNTPGSTYTWTITGGTIASGQGTNSIEVNWGSEGMVGNVEVVEHNGCTYGAPVNLSVVIHTIQPSSISGPTFVPVEQTGVSYSVNDTSGYSYTWTITGGTLASGQNSTDITVDWDNISEWGNVSVVASSSCGDAAAKDLDVWKYIVIESITTGNWDDVNTWDCHCVPLETDNVRINNGHTVSVNVANATIKSITITPAGVLAAGNRDFTATGHVTIDGHFTGTNILTLSGNNTTISGIGNIDNTKELSITGGNKTIASNCIITKTASNVDITSGIAVTNNGIFSIQNGDLTLSTTSSWENAEYSTLELGGEIALTTGDLFASAFYNTVNYCSAGDQNVRSTTYYHLITSGEAAGTKTLAGHVTINGNFTINTAATCDVSTNNYDMYIHGNWTNNGDFIPQLGTVYFEDTEKQIISGTTANTFYNVVFNNTTGSNADIMIEDNDFTVSNSATFTQGIVNTDTNTFVFGTSATTNEGSITSFIDGPAEKTSATAAFTFPIGHVTDRDIGDGLQTYKIWAPFTATPAASTNINVRYFYSNENLHTWWYHDWTHEYPLTHTTDREYWLVNSAQNLDVTLSWRNNNPCYIHDFCDGGSQLQYLTTAYWDNIWKDAGGDASAESTVTGDISSSISIPFGAKGEKQITFSGTSKDIPLPIELLNFDVTCDHENDAIDVSWTTANETNNDYFTLYRSVDGVSFEEIKRITGSGTTSQSQTYAFTDDFAPVGDVYYKLSQTDFDGLTENFMVTSINCFTPDDKISVKVFPNPFRDYLNVVFTNWPEGQTTLGLIDMQGRILLQKNALIQGVKTHIKLRLNDIAPGMYILNLRTDKVNKNLKIEKQ